MKHARAVIAVCSSLALVVATFSCRGANSPEGMECNDPKIDSKVERLIVGNSDRVHGDTRVTSPYLTTLEEAKAFLANPDEPRTGVATDPNAHPTIQERVDAFLEKTDFSRQKLTFTVVDTQGSEGFVGEIQSPGHVVLIFHTCSQMGGTPPPMVEFTAVYRIPKEADVTRGDCGSCPQVECCPP